MAGTGRLVALGRLAVATGGVSMLRSIYLFLLSAFFALAAIAGAADDVDFFNPADFADTTALHHEHLVVLVGGLALASFVLGVLLYVRELRAIQRRWAEERV